MIAEDLSYILFLVPFLLAMYHRLRRKSELEIDFVAFTVLLTAAVLGGVVSIPIREGIWPLIFVQLALVAPATIWGVRRLRSGRMQPGMSNRSFTIVMRAFLVAGIVALVLIGVWLGWPEILYLSLVAAVCIVIVTVLWRRMGDPNNETASAE